MGWNGRPPGTSPRATRWDDEDLDTYPIDQPEYALGDDLPHPDRYSIIVRIPAADRFFSSRLQRVGREYDVREQFGVEGEGF